MATCFAEHPISKKEKASILKKFDRIIDHKFAPDKLENGDKLLMKNKPVKSKDEKKES